MLGSHHRSHPGGFEALCDGRRSRSHRRCQHARDQVCRCEVQRPSRRARAARTTRSSSGTSIRATPRSGETSCLMSGPSTSPSRCTATRISSFPCAFVTPESNFATAPRQSPISGIRRPSRNSPKTRSKKERQPCCSPPHARTRSMAFNLRRTTRRLRAGRVHGRRYSLQHDGSRGYGGGCSDSRWRWSVCPLWRARSSTGSCSTTSTGLASNWRWPPGRQRVRSRGWLLISDVGRSVYFFTDSQEFGGAEHALLILIENLDRDAWRPTLLYNATTAVEPLVERARKLDVQVRPVPSMPLGLEGARRVPALARELRLARPSVFHAHLSWPLAAKYGLVSAVLARVPVVVATVQLFPEFRLDRSNAVQARLLARSVDRYIAVSHDIAKRLVQTFHLPTQKIEVIHNAVQSERFRHPVDPRLREQLTGGTELRVCFTAARLDAQKGLDVLLQAATQVSGARFVLAGEGPERSRLEQRVATLGLGDRVQFLGHRNDIPELFAACDVFVLPSLYEGSSLAVLEAMAAGRPIVTSAIGGTDELIVHDASGLLVPPGDADALALALQRVLADAALSRAPRRRRPRTCGDPVLCDCGRRACRSLVRRPVGAQGSACPRLSSFQSASGTSFSGGSTGDSCCGRIGNRAASALLRAASPGRPSSSRRDFQRARRIERQSTWPCS